MSRAESESAGRGAARPGVTVCVNMYATDTSTSSIKTGLLPVGFRSLSDSRIRMHVFFGKQFQ